MEESREERSARLIEEMKRSRGYIYPEWEYMAKQDPDFAELYQQVYERCFGEGENLPARYREIGPIALLAYKGHTDAVVHHMKRAIRLGATEGELFDAVMTLFAPGGAPTMLVGLSALMKLKEESD